MKNYKYVIACSILLLFILTALHSREIPNTYDNLSTVPYAETFYFVTEDEQARIMEYQPYDDSSVAFDAETFYLATLMGDVSIERDTTEDDPRYRHYVITRLLEALEGTSSHDEFMREIRRAQDYIRTNRPDGITRIEIVEPHQFPMPPSVHSQRVP